MNRLLAIACLLALPGYCIADEPTSKPVAKQPDLSQLLERLGQLERRIAELETRQTPLRPVTPQATTPPNGHLPQSPTQVIPPNPNSYSTQPPTYSTPLTPMQPRQGSAPQGWQRFNFNGQWFYIVPIDGNQASAAFGTP
ncbi:MAG: hypothetical protein WBD31_17440 [Rubripirellula sp.]